MTTHLPRFPKGEPQRQRTGRFLRGRSARKVLRLARLLAKVRFGMSLPREFWSATADQKNDALAILREATTDPAMLA